jgi:hypothetical protein
MGQWIDLRESGTSLIHFSTRPMSGSVSDQLSIIREHGVYRSESEGGRTSFDSFAVERGVGGVVVARCGEEKVVDFLPVCGRRFG